MPPGLVIVCQMSCFAITFSSDLHTVYYRPYQEDGAIESRSPAYSNDRSIGRILSKDVTPPHTAASLKSFAHQECRKKFDRWTSNQQDFLRIRWPTTSITVERRRLLLLQ